MKKLVAVLMTALLLCSSFAIFPVSADGNIIVFQPTQAGDSSDGSWFASGGVSAAESYGDLGLDITATFRTLWGFPDSMAAKMPFLIIEVEEGIENISRFTATHLWHSSVEASQVDIDIASANNNTICINTLELLAHEEGSDGYLYLVPYIDGRVVFSKLYISDTDLDGNVYVPPTQPKPMWNDGGKLIRYDMPAYDDGDHTTPIEGTNYGYGWLMVQPDGSIPVQITEHEDGKGFYMERKEGFEGWAAANIAYVIPYEQLEKTPYLAVDISNEGRPDEGPQVDIYAYWEGITGSLARLDGIDTWTGANGLKGTRAYNLKYAVDQVSEDKHGEYGIALIVALNWAGERTDGTCMDPLKIEDLYLFGWEGGTESNLPYAEYMNNPTTATTAPVGGDDADAADGEFPIVPVAAAAGAVIVVACIVAILFINKKK